MGKNKLVSIEALRFIFMTIIAIWHFGRINPFTHGYIAVDFFFILSGFLIYNSYIRHKYDALEYTIAKLKRFYPEYIIVFLISFFMKLRILLRDNDIVTVLLNAISEGTLIHGIGIYSGYVNPPSWYVSVLLIGGGILYSILFYNRKLAISIIFPLFTLLSYTYLLGINGSLEQFATVGCVSQCLLRGMSGMALGIILSAFSRRYTEVFINRDVLLNILCIISITIICVVLFAIQNYDNIALLVFSLLIVSCVIPNLLFNKIFKLKIWTKLGGVTFEMLLVHSPVIWVINNLTRSIPLSFLGKIMLAIVYMGIVVIVSFILKSLNNRIRMILK